LADRFILTPFFLDDPLPGLESLIGPGWRLNRPEGTSGTRDGRMAEIHDSLARHVAEAIRDGDRPVSIAGDCCAALGVLAGLQRAGMEPGLIWLDAHGDFNTRETSPSGFLGGMPLAWAVGEGDRTFVDAVGLRPLPEPNIILADARDLDPGERERVEASGLTHLKDVQALLDHPLPTGPLYVHLDTDVVDPADAPAMNYPAPGGPSAAAVGEVFEHLAATGRIAAVSMSTWNPQLEAADESERACMALLGALLGRSARKRGDEE